MSGGTGVKVMEERGRKSNSIPILPFHTTSLPPRRDPGLISCPVLYFFYYPGLHGTYTHVAWSLMLYSTEEKSECRKIEKLFNIIAQRARAVGQRVSYVYLWYTRVSCTRKDFTERGLEPQKSCTISKFPMVENNIFLPTTCKYPVWLIIGCKIIKQNEYQSNIWEVF
jgi:hypothetical protein